MLQIYSLNQGCGFNNPDATVNKNEIQIRPKKSGSATLFYALQKNVLDNLLFLFRNGNPGRECQVDERDEEKTSSYSSKLFLTYLLTYLLTN